MPRRKRPAPKVTDAELAILDVLWRRGEATIRQIAGELYPGGAASEYATVQKLLERLEAKGCVLRDRSSFAHLFRAQVERGDLIDQRLAEVAEKLCEGSLTPLLLHLAGSRRLSKKEREALRKLLEEG